MLAESVEDILQEIAPQLSAGPMKSVRTRTPPPVALTLFEQRLFEVLRIEPMHIDAVVEQSGLSASDALVHLLGLEFKGLVRQLPGKFFVKM